MWKYVEYNEIVHIKIMSSLQKPKSIKRVAEAGLQYSNIQLELNTSSKLQLVPMIKDMLMI
jgi:hypothetical protein